MHFIASLFVPKSMPFDKVFSKCLLQKITDFPSLKMIYPLFSTAFAKGGINEVCSFFVKFYFFCCVICVTFLDWG